jgi:hypothetical protein
MEVIRENITGAIQMKSLAITAALLSAVGATAFMSTVVSTVPANARCMVNEGNGRYTPCDALYKSKKCLVDEGYGRRTPCEAMVKQKKVQEGLTTKSLQTRIRRFQTKAAENTDAGTSFQPLPGAGLLWAALWRGRGCDQFRITVEIQPIRLGSSQHGDDVEGERR